jgi:1-acyl-sn-glycerol-3-phosphate acyltransferase
MTAALVAGLLKLLCGAQSRWLGVAPSTDVRIYFANHTSNLDAVVLWATLPPELRERTRPVAAKDYWTKGRVRPFLAQRAFHALLIERRKVTVRDNPLEDMLTALDAGSSLILFPEGGRHPGPEPHPFKSGLFHLAKQRPQVGLIPVFLENLNRLLPKGEILPVPLLGSVTIGAPIQLGPAETKIDFLERARLAVWNLHLS